VAFTVADYVLKRLTDQHVETLFGVRAAYCAPLFDAAVKDGMTSVVTCPYRKLKTADCRRRIG
jgi:indolepyruvate decarboxylase